MTIDGSRPDSCTWYDRLNECHQMSTVNGGGRSGLTTV